MERKRETALGEGKKKSSLKKTAHDLGDAVGTAAGSIGKAAVTVGGKAKDAAVKSKEAVFGAIDQNGNGEIDIEDVIIMGMRVPGVHVDREAFLRKEFQNKLPQETIDKAVAFTPLHARIPTQMIDGIANEVIQYERTCVSGISTALGVPGGVAMVATIPADIAQYYGYMLRAAQKLMYLYGFPAIDLEEKGPTFDSETMNTLIICMGVMYSVQGANAALKAMAKALATGVEKQLLQKALTKGTIYPIVKSISKWFSIHMTKEVFAGFFKKAIPIVGGILGGGITYLSFKPCCERLKSSLQHTMLSDPNYHVALDEDVIIADAIDVSEAYDRPSFSTLGSTTPLHKKERRALPVFPFRVTCSAPRRWPWRRSCRRPWPG